MRTTIISLVLLLNLVAVFASFPSYLTRCKKDDADFDACVLKAAQDGLSFILKGDEALGIPSYSPLIWKTKKHLGGLFFKFDVSDIVVSNISSSTVSEVQWDVDNKKVHILFKFDEVNWDFNLETQGLFLGKSLNGKGRAQKDYINGWYTYDMQYDTVKVDNVLYPRIKSDKADFGAERTVYHFSHLDDNITRLVNNSWQQFSKLLHKQVSEFVVENITPAFAAIFKATPIDELFL